MIAKADLDTAERYAGLCRATCQTQIQRWKKADDRSGSILKMLSNVFTVAAVSIKRIRKPFHSVMLIF